MGKNIRIIILVFLIVMMIFVWSFSFEKFRPRRVQPKGLSVTGELQVSKDFLFWANKTLKKRQESKFKHWGRNPFSLAKGITTVAGLNLMGVFWDKDSPQAIINEKIIGVGDVIEGHEVIEILQDRVILSDGQNKFELRF